MSLTFGYVAFYYCFFLFWLSDFLNLQLTQTHQVHNLFLQSTGTHKHPKYTIGFFNMIKLILIDKDERKPPKCCVSDVSRLSYSQTFARGEETYDFFSKGTYKVGRKEIIIDASISIDNIKKKSSKLRIKDCSKYGTFITNPVGSNEKVHEFPNKETTMDDEDLELV